MKKTAKRFREINIVPYIDVMLVLLIIFMATAPFLTQGVKVDLPRTAAKALVDKASQPPIIISIDINGNYYLNIAQHPTQPIDKTSLMTRVAAAKQLNADRSVLIQGDQGVDYGKVVLIMGLLQSIKVDKVGLITSQIEQNRQAKG